MRLYEMTDEMEVLDKAIDVYASEHEGELPEELSKQLDSLKGERVEKLLNLAVWQKSLIAEANAFKDELKRLQARQKALNNKAESIKDYIDNNMTDREKLSDNRSVLSFRSSTQAVIECMLDELPAEFVKVEKSAKLIDLKKAINGGRDVRGVFIKTNYNLQIK